MNRRTNAVLPSYESRISRELHRIRPRSYIISRTRKHVWPSAIYFRRRNTRYRERSVSPQRPTTNIAQRSVPENTKLRRKWELSLRNGKSGWLLINNGDIHSRDLVPPVCFNFHGVTSYRRNKYSHPIDQISHSIMRIAFHKSFPSTNFLSGGARAAAFGEYSRTLDSLSRKQTDRVNGSILARQKLLLRRGFRSRCTRFPRVSMGNSASIRLDIASCFIDGTR